MVFKATICGSVHPKWALTAFNSKIQNSESQLIKNNLCVRGFIVLWTKYQKTRQSYKVIDEISISVSWLLKKRIEGSESLFWFISPIEWFNIGMSKEGGPFMTLL